MAYLDTIRSIFADYGIPRRIAYLPHVESSFNYESYSKVGAAGVLAIHAQYRAAFFTH